MDEKPEQPNKQTTPLDADVRSLKGLVRSALRPRQDDSVRRLFLYVGLFVLLCQLIFVYAFFPSFKGASSQLFAGQGGGVSIESKYAYPDLLQWSGAQSLVWIASLFAPDTPVRFAPALIFFLIAGGFLSAMCRPAESGSMPKTVVLSARTGMRLWLSWFAGAAIVLVYLLTSSGGMEAFRVSAGITFERPWKDISDAFLSHWLVYIAWFALLGFLPMVGGGMLGLVRTRLLTSPVTDKEPGCRDENGDAAN